MGGTNKMHSRLMVFVSLKQFRLNDLLFLVRRNIILFSHPFLKEISIQIANQNAKLFLLKDVYYFDHHSNDKLLHSPKTSRECCESLKICLAQQSDSPQMEIWHYSFVRHHTRKFSRLCHTKNVTESFSRLSIRKECVTKQVKYFLSLPNEICC